MENPTMINCGTCQLKNIMFLEQVWPHHAWTIEMLRHQWSAQSWRGVVHLHQWKKFGLNMQVVKTRRKSNYKNPTQINPCLAEWFPFIFCHLKLELLTQFTASNGKKYIFIRKIDICQVQVCDYRTYITNYFVHFKWHCIWFKTSLNPCICGHSRR